MAKLSGKVALINGSGRNIGRAIALELAREGANVVVNSKSNLEEAESVVKEAQGLGVKAIATLADVSVKSQVDDMFKKALATFGRIDILINNAALRPQKSFSELSVGEWRDAIGVILDGAFYCTQAALPSMLEHQCCIIRRLQLEEIPCMRYQVLSFILAAILLAACSTTSAAQSTPTLDAVQEQGRAVYNLRCAQCHALEPNTVVIGPSLAGIATRAGSRVPGYDAETYIEHSILFPREYIVEGFTDTMPTNFGKELTSDELKAVISFLMTLK